MSYREIAAYNLEMVEDTVLLRIPAHRLEELCGQSLELANWMRKLLDYYLREYENYFINDSWSDAREQYETLLRTRPDLFQFPRRTRCADDAESSEFPICFFIQFATTATTTYHKPCLSKLYIVVVAK